MLLMQTEHYLATVTQGTVFKVVRTVYGFHHVAEGRVGQLNNSAPKRNQVYHIQIPESTPIPSPSFRIPEYMTMQMFFPSARFSCWTQEVSDIAARSTHVLEALSLHFPCVCWTYEE